MRSMVWFAAIALLVGSAWAQASGSKAASIAPSRLASTNLSNATGARENDSKATMELDTLLFQDFESGMGDWTTGYAPVIWWHSTDDAELVYDVKSWWCANEEWRGYDNEWLQCLTTPDIALPAVPDGDLMLTFRMNIEIEPAAPYGEYDSWDGFNVRLSNDGGATFTPIAPVGGYPYTSMFGFGHNGECAGVPGWGGSSAGWVEEQFNLNSYTGETVQIRFVFGSDPAACTIDGDGDPDWFGVLVDEIRIADGSGEFFYDNGNEDGTSEMVPGDVLPIIGQRFELDETQSHSPAHSVRSRNNLGKKARIVSPEFHIPERFLASISYWVYCDLPDFDSDEDDALDDYYQVYVSTDDGTTWEYITHDYYRNSPATGWALWTNDSIFTGTLNLYDYINMDVMISFLQKNDCDDDGGLGAGLYLDDICVAGFTGNSSDAGVSGVMTSPINVNQDIVFNVEVQGFGVETVAPSVWCRIYDDTGTPVTTPGILGSATVAFGQRVCRPYTWRPTEAGYYYMMAWTILTSDEDATNDTFRFDFAVPMAEFRELGYDDAEQDTFGGSYLYISPGVDTLDEPDDEGYAVDFSCPYDETQLDGIAVKGAGYGNIECALFEMTIDGPAFMPAATWNFAFPPEGIDKEWAVFHMTEEYVIPYHDFVIGVWAADTESYFLVGVDRDTPHDGHSWLTEWEPDYDMYDFFHLTDASEPYNEFDFMIRCFVHDYAGIEEKGIPGKFALEQNFPNPFNPATEIAFSLPEPTDVSLIVYDISGKVVRNLLSCRKGAGSHKIIWDGADNSGNEMPSGIYFYKLVAGDNTSVKKMMMVR